MNFSANAYKTILRSNTLKSFHSLRLSNNPTSSHSPHYVVQHKSISEPSFDPYHSRASMQHYNQTVKQHSYIHPSNCMLQRKSMDPNDSSTEEEEEEDMSDSQSSSSESTLSTKIADLKMANKSLLTINKVLESTVRQQAKHIAFLQDVHLYLHERSFSYQAIESEQSNQLDRLERKIEMMIQEGERALAYQVGVSDCVLASNGDHNPLLRSSHTHSKHRSRKRLK
ncbi:hypothetical protein A0J61_06368 [Choanephora cucurbitarum]|uniref:Uncharacterized protein n=1 Tax=Choanephora cucurbitarum TaxID=101091 RepID=A0A1C7NAD0_9FUNG|nr:hypothetical protein A0J61_06368 [Choanephora cucurbitarum]